MTALSLNCWSEADAMAVREQLDRLLKSGPFQQSRRRQRFLDYIVNETLAGRGDRIKGYNLAVKVFDRPATFDPNIDPVVRIEAVRVRDRLREYYEGDGLNDPIRIDLPKGSYTPQIEFRETAPDKPHPADGILLDLRTDTFGSPTPVAFIKTRPSIAVLPFVNMSAKRSDDYLSDAITENIITALSRFRDLAVTASYSVFSYKGKGRRIPEIARELGVRFVLEGSVQKSKERVTITAQLIDGSTGAHLWAERFDRSYGNLLAVLDEVTMHIVGRLGSPYSGRVGKAWRGQPDAGIGKLQAYDHLLAGLDIFDNYVLGCMAEAREQFFKAIELDPTLGKAYAKIAFSHILDAWLGWSENPEVSLAEARRYTGLTIECDDDEAWGHWAMGLIHLLGRQHDRAIASYQRALKLNPNDPDILSDYGFCLSCSGRSDEAVATVHKAMQINPHYPEWWLMSIGPVFFDARRYEQAIAALESVRAIDTIGNHLCLAASHAALGHTRVAQAEILKIREMDPNTTISSVEPGFLELYREAADREHMRLNLIKAGLPE